jgi:ubiquinone/menaquinone biosynthesis C-methylase UbiE
MSILSSSIRLFQKQSKVDAEWRRAFIDMLEKNPNAKMLDLGCYQGDFTLMAAKKIQTKLVTGVDALDTMKINIESKGITFCKADLNEKLPFEDKSFDVVCASQLIEHISNTDTFVKEIHRVLTDDGYAVISTPNLANSYNIICLMLGWQPPASHVSDEMPFIGTLPLLRNKDKPFPMIQHKRIFTMPALEELFVYHGFKIENKRGSGFFPFPAPLARFVCHIDNKHSINITIKARRRMLFD